MPKAKDYRMLSAELDNILDALQQPDVQVSDAVVSYEKGLKLIAELEAHVSQAENKLERLRLQARGEEA